MSDLPRHDLWEQMDSWLTHLREHPEIERRLMDGPLETLGPADQRFRAGALDDRGQFDLAKEVRDQATPVYTAQRWIAGDGHHVGILCARGKRFEVVQCSPVREGPIPPPQHRRFPELELLVCEPLLIYIDAQARPVRHQIAVALHLQLHRKQFLVVG